MEPGIRTGAPPAAAIAPFGSRAETENLSAPTPSRALSAGSRRRSRAFIIEAVAPDHRNAATQTTNTPAIPLVASVAVPAIGAPAAQPAQHGQVRPQAAHRFLGVDLDDHVGVAAEDPSQPPGNRENLHVEHIRVHLLPAKQLAGRRALKDLIAPEHPGYGETEMPDWLDGWDDLVRGAIGRAWPGEEPLE